MTRMMKKAICILFFMSGSAILGAPDCLTTADRQRYSDHPLRLVGGCECRCEKQVKLSYTNVCPECRHTRYARLPIMVNKNDPSLARHHEQFATQEQMNGYTSPKSTVARVARFLAWKRMQMTVSCID